VNVVSRTVARGGMVYVQAAGQQTRSVLDRIDALLAAAGFDKSKILTAEVLLADTSLRKAHDAAWSEWIDGQHSPLLTCRPAALAHPDALVEITVTAAR
jgi:enamine deaminase RidA (YjgF/YER057c/UK114 family)